MLLTHHHQMPDRAAPALIEASSARLLHAYLTALDADDVRDEAVTTLAAEIYDREIGSRMRAKDISEATGEILSALDEAEEAEMEAAYGRGEYGAWLQPKVAAYWRAWCREQARQQLDKLDREAEDDHYREQVAA